jgi:pyruvate,water dikinase
MAAAAESPERPTIISGLDQIEGLCKGDILICNATDPGWTPALLTVRGVIAETGGLLAHVSCLSREYGMPAIQLASAMKRITDGANITMEGATAEVIVHDDEPTPDTNGTVPATTIAELDPA